MMNSEGKVEVRLFYGTLVTSEIRMHLKSSDPWKAASIERDGSHLIETHFQGKDYVGLFLEDHKTTIPSLHLLRIEILRRLQSYCDRLFPETFQMHIFPQLFIS